MSHRFSMLFTLMVVGMAVGTAVAQDALGDGSNVNVYQFAVANPVDNSALTAPPALGESVPVTVSLVSLAGGSSYAYFYYNGRPVIVDLTTRSVVRVGQ